MIGAIPPRDVPSFLQNTDIYLFPSHFEGCPNALLEALMAGCVAISWQIDGITDFVLENGGIGYLLPTGDYEAVVAKVRELHNHRIRLADLGKAAAKSARKRFTPNRTAKAYAAIFEDVMQKPPPAFTPLEWSSFRPDPNFEHRWTEEIPDWMKNIAKKLKWAKG